MSKGKKMLFFFDLCQKINLLIVTFYAKRGIFQQQEIG